tara:strand:- start:97127 stop:97780 length:654 start_codon:yes stop_codon:yes gene_type:complete
MISKNIRNEAKRITVEYIKKAFSRNENGPRGLNHEKFLDEYLGHIQRLLEVDEIHFESKLRADLGRHVETWLSTKLEGYHLDVEACTVAFGVIHRMGLECHHFIINMTGYTVFVFDADRYISSFKPMCEKDEIPTVVMRDAKIPVGSAFEVPVQKSRTHTEDFPYKHGVAYLVNRDVAMKLAQIKACNDFILTYDGKVLLGDMGLGIYTHKLHKVVS